jgi:hypothetical protein
MLSWVIDGIMLVLLALVLLSTMTLSSRLKVLRDSRRDFEAIVKQFDEASKRADAGIKALQAAAGKSGEALQGQLERARSLRDELSMMIESADSMAKRLETAAPAKAAEVARQAEPTSAARSKAELDLLRMMSGKREGGAS